ncbi:NAD(P)/FAD-dependent oxidoreductase [Thiovibrio sp. JS02]
MKNYHTVIVGAGPAGLACATSLARHGKEVLVLERNARIGPKVCAGGIPSATLTLGVPAEILERAFTSQRILSNWQKTTIRDDKPMVCTVDRGRLGRWMAQKAAATGVTIKTDTPTTGMDEKKVYTRAGEFGYDFLVGADGSGSMVRRRLGIATRRCGVGIHFQIPGNYQAMEWHLDTKLFGNGYAWIFPHRDTASIGVYDGGGKSKPGALLNSLRRWAARFDISLPSHQPRAALVNFDYQGFRFDNRFLVGDAAGLASGLTGEGIYSAILSGEEAARSILDKDYECAPLAELIAKQRRHSRILELASGSRFGGRLILESLILALRAGLIDYHELEMGLHPPQTRTAP